jgi:phosphoribosylglycinamide formyltransferase 1
LSETSKRKHSLKIKNRGIQKDRLVVLASGNGSNLQAIIDACASGELTAEVVAVISDQAKAYALERAKKAGIPAHIFGWRPYQEANLERCIYDKDLAALVESFSPDWIVLAGWMRLLTSSFLGAFPMQVINLHPALPGSYPGTHAIERAWGDYQAGLIQHTGVMVHFVPDEGVDNGPVIADQMVPITRRDNLETLTERIHQVEHSLLIKSIQHLILKKNLPTDS